VVVVVSVWALKSYICCVSTKLFSLAGIVPNEISSGGPGFNPRTVHF
jgi:hypothetical protein